MTRIVWILERAAVSPVCRERGRERLSRLESAMKESAGVGRFSSNNAVQV